MPMRYKFTSESVGEGHPDKIADQISDAVLDACIKGDKNSHVGCETFVTGGLVVVGGEINTQAYVDINSLVRHVVRDIGYNDGALGLDYRSMGVVNTINAQSEDINRSINTPIRNKSGSIGAGDQGIMFGYACRETETLMPAAIMIAHKIMLRAAELRKGNAITWLGPDSKCQVTLEYEDQSPQRVDTIIVSNQHAKTATQSQLQDFFIHEVIKPILNEFHLTYDQQTVFLINPSGRFVLGGPNADAGLTGRKIIADTYGGAARHGGGAFSGKDPTKVDRSAAYMARKVAKNVVAAGFAERCEIQISYAIGVPQPISTAVFTFGTETVRVEDIIRAINTVFNFSPTQIIADLDLLNPIYQQSATYGHFGREIFSWEQCDKVSELQSAI